MRYLLLITLISACLLLSGCETPSTTAQKNKGRLSVARVGMTEMELTSAIGAPQYVEQGKRERSMESVWVYPGGNVHFYRMTVTRIAEGEPPPPRTTTEIDRGSKYFMENSLHSREDEWYRRDKAEREAEAERIKKRNTSLFRPSVTR